MTIAQIRDWLLLLPDAYYTEMGKWFSSGLGFRVYRNNQPMLHIVIPFSWLREDMIP